MEGVVVVEKQAVVPMVLMVVAFSNVVMVCSGVVVVTHKFLDLGRVTNIIDSICISQTCSLGRTFPFVFT